MATQDHVVTREVKVGLAVIALLTLTIAWTVARRFLRSADAPTTAVEAVWPNQQHTAPVLETATQPTVLPPSNRYLGPAAYVEPQVFTPTPSIESEESVPFDPRPSLLPTLPKSERPLRSAELPGREAPLTPVPRPIDQGRIRDAPVDLNPVKKQGAALPASDGVISASAAVDSSHRLITCDREATGCQPTTILEPNSGSPPSSPAHSFSPDKTVVPKSQAQTINAGVPEILPTNYAHLTPGRKYLVEEGDTLSVIARFELGDAERWPEVYYLNRDQFDSWTAPLSPGTWLVLPSMIP